MATRSVAPLSVSDLLARFSGEPHDAVTFVSTLYRYPNLSELREVIGKDRRFRAPLLRFVACLHEAKDALPWMWSLVPRDDPRFVAPLVDVWRAWKGQHSAKAAETLLEMGERSGLEAMASLAGKAPPAFRAGPLEALMRLDVAKAYDRAIAALALDPQGLWLVLGAVTKAHVVADPRWLELAMRSLQHPEKNVRASARSVVDELASRTAKAALLAKATPRSKDAREPPVSVASLDAHRAVIARLLEKLPAGGFTLARKDASKRLAELTKLLGHVPGAVSAFYERIDAIEIERGKPRDRFIVVPLAEVLGDARRWAAANRRKPPALREPFHWPVSPDGATKSGLSGGPAYGFDAPTDDDDPVLDAPRRPTFSRFVTGAVRLRKT